MRIDGQRHRQAVLLPGCVEVHLRLGRDRDEERQLRTRRERRLAGRGRDRDVRGLGRRGRLRGLGARIDDQGEHGRSEDAEATCRLYRQRPASGTAPPRRGNARGRAIGARPRRRTQKRNFAMTRSSRAPRNAFGCSAAHRPDRRARGGERLGVEPGEEDVVRDERRRDGDRDSASCRSRSRCSGRTGCRRSARAAAASHPAAGGCATPRDRCAPAPTSGRDCRGRCRAPARPGSSPDPEAACRCRRRSSSRHPCPTATRRCPGTRTRPAGPSAAGRSVGWPLSSNDMCRPSNMRLTFGLVRPFSSELARPE